MMVMMEPVEIPAAPIPATARPKMKTGELGAAPQIAEPISKIAMQVRNVHRKS